MVTLWPNECQSHQVSCLMEDGVIHCHGIDTEYRLGVDGTQNVHFTGTDHSIQGTGMLFKNSVIRLI